ncbi:hypothetical protein LTR17_026793 [Elasticomyces elasticus]|nr:hypothetical protein LTR17_026793 [Elasticomyces elasticus]
MPTTLANPSQATKDGILLPIIDAHLNGSLGKNVFEFATTLFGADAVDEMEKEGKEERKEAFPCKWRRRGHGLQELDAHVRRVAEAGRGDERRGAEGNRRQTLL